MGKFTIRMPDDIHKRLKSQAKRRSISLNKLIEELSTVALAQSDAETRFIAMAARGSVPKGLALLDKLDKELV
ncbi:MAG: toxin-antitoxin system HicB family antitoxin [Magnetococcales bacterium]|nr:toxin-antitoxin system HicB family antitoxin [Magnetococcales bacterium]